MMISPSSRCCHALVRLLLAVCWLGLASGTLAAATQTISGEPLEISVDDSMNVTVQRYEVVAGSSPVTYEYDRQYFSVYSPFLVVTPPGVGAPGTPLTYSGYSSYPNNATAVTPVSNTTMPDGSIVTVVTAANGDITIQQTVSYVAGAQQYQHSWVVTNTNPNATYTGVYFRYGGDTYFADSDEATGFWDPTENFVYCTNPNVSGLMGILGSPQTPATNYYEDGYYAVWTALENPSAPLPDTVNSTFIDNGMGLEWVEGTLAPLGTFNVTAIEKWTAAGAVQVLAPQPVTTTVGSQLSLSFTVQNLESTSDTFTLAATSSTGLVANAPTSVQVAANSSAIVTVSVAVNSLSGQPLEVTLTATSQTDSTIANQDSVAISAAAGTVQVSPPDATLYIGAGAAVTVPFVVTNQESIPDSFSLTGSASSGLTAGTLAAVTLAAGASATIQLPVTCQTMATQPLSKTVSLTATSRTNAAITASATYGFTSSPILLTLTTAPPAVTNGQETAAGFTLTNGESASDTFSFYAGSSSGLQTTGIANVTVTANGTQAVSLPIDVITLLGTSGTVTLTAMSTTTPGITAQATVTMTPAPVLVSGPSVQTAAGEANFQLAFTVVNTTGSAATYNLSVNTLPGLTISAPATVVVGGNSSGTVLVTVTVNTPLASGSVDLVTLTATLPQSVTSATGTTVVIPPRSVLQPGLPLSSGPATVFNSICACTPEGVANILAVMAGQTDLTAAAYAWDATTQSYVTLPTQPSGGLSPSSGIFIATRLNLPFDFSGTPTEVPATKILLPGWNFVGLPALDESGTAVVNATWPSDFALYDANGALVDPSANPTTFINDLGTVGSSDLTTAEPYLYNGSGYVQVATLQTGTGYWIKNNNVSGTLFLVRLAPVFVTLARSAAASSAATSTGTTTSGSTAGTASYIDRGAPPDPPSSSAASDGGSHGCGLGAGLASLLGFGLLLMRRRLRG